MKPEFRIVRVGSPVPFHDCRSNHKVIKYCFLLTNIGMPDLFKPVYTLYHYFAISCSVDPRIAGKF